MTPDERAYIAACKQQGLIIDTNLLIVLLVGSYDPAKIQSCCGSSFTEDTFVFIKRLIALTTPKRIIVTPQILVEVHNLTFHKIKEPGLHNYVEKLIEIISQTHEERTEREVFFANAKMLAAFGFTDLGIADAAQRLKCAVITDDNRLTAHLLETGCHAKSIVSVMPMVPA